MNPELKNIVNKGTEDWMQYTVEIDLNQVDINIRNKIKTIKCIEMGKDAEYWGGHYGAQ
jgi:hypothetical protein